MKDLHVKLTFAEQILGSAPANRDLVENFIASKAPSKELKNEELDAFSETEEMSKMLTVFPKENEKPLLWDYQVKGFFKASIEALINAGTLEVNNQSKPKLSNYTRGKLVDTLFFVYPRKIFYQLPDGGEIGIIQRTLRASTMRGDRVAIAASETLPAGTTVEMQIRVLNDKFETVVRQCLDYGEYNGLGQWRNSGKGSFTWEEIKPKKKK